MEAKKQREPLTVVPGLAVVLVKAGQINPRVVACALTEEEAARKVAVQDGQQRFIIEIAAVRPPAFEPNDRATTPSPA